MTQATTDVLEYDEHHPPKLTTGLNVLTILTFIGCAYELYSTTNNFFSGKKALEEFEKAQEKLADAPAWARKFAGPEMHDMLVKSLENRIPLIIIGLISIALCVFGAIEMRKLKKQGFTLWLIGEILPYIGVAVFIGAAFFKTILVYFTIVPAIFILLYALQRKNLRY
jgi:hypothetical protein